MNTVLFDMDGVLVNSEPIIFRSARKALASEGLALSEADFTPYLGAGEENFILGPAKTFGKMDRAQAMLRILYDDFREAAFRELTAFDGAGEVIAALLAQEVTLALVSSSSREKLLISLEAVGIPADSFSLILCGDDVTEKKPSPQPYATAVTRLGKVPSDCLVIEDALNGIASAKAAGICCAAVTTSFSASALKEAGADFILSNLREIPAILKQRG